MKLIVYRIYQLVVMLPVIVVSTIITAAITVMGCALGNAHFWGYWPPHFWARIFLAVSLVRVKVTGYDNVDANTSYVFVANHQGAYDIFAIYGYLNHNFKWMMKKELMKFPIIGPSCKAAGHIFVDNSTPAATRHTMERAEQTLRGGMSLVIFPEGSRTFTGKMGRFRRGAFKLAQEFALPVVPVTIDGAFDVMPRTSLLPKWGTIKITIHKPLAAPADEADCQRVSQQAAQEVASALPVDLR